MTLSISITYIAGVIIFAPLLKKLKRKGYVGKDMYKLGHPPVPEMGGMGIAFAFLAGILFLMSIGEMPFSIYPALFVLLFYFIFGLLDDLLGIGGDEDVSHDKMMKILVPLFFAFPLTQYVSTSIHVSSYTLQLGVIYLLIILPFYIMVCANLVNMFSYYNGQSAGTTLIILAFASLKLYRSGDIEILYLIFPFLGANLAFLSYNLQPAGVFPGDSGDLFMGAMIGIVAILGNMEVFIFIALIPLSLNFLMVAYWFLRDRRKTKTKFGDVRPDGTIDAPNQHTLMWFFPYHLSLTEKQTTFIMYFLVLLSTLLAWVIC